MNLPSDCARAATAEEARFRVDYPNSKPRASKIIALDDAAAVIMGDLETASWKGACFLSLVGRTRGMQGLDAIPLDLDLRNAAGAVTLLSKEIAGADVVVMIASAGEPVEDASIIAKICAARGIMTTGVIVEGGARADEVERTLTALRPNARMLVVASDADYIPEMLMALRA
ncbi:MAG: 3-methyl-2-oxobutanoate hydroxymethyltransferase [Alphaproteobacteria bacterium]|nr:3-methyl-2-oxobutanoate hydroxymethyltransferase [Alphaproteobacteria bacterium]